MTPITQTICDGVSMLTCKDTRFHTVRLTAAAFLPLREDTAAANAMLAGLITHASAKYPDMVTLGRALSRLYGATVSAYVSRFGDHQILHFTVTCIENRYALQGEHVVDAAVDMLLSMLFEPHLDADGLFAAEDFEQEKRCLLEQIAAEINDKRYYARMQCDRLLADGDVYGIPIYGTADAVQALTREDVTNAWKNLLTAAKFQWVCCGESTPSTDPIAARFATVRRAVQYGSTDTVFTSIDTPRREVCAMDVAQAKLAMGFRLSAADPDIHAVAVARLMVALYGGTAHSLLFRHVREEKSLCYYCSAAIDRVKGVMTVDSGVEPHNLDTAEQEILRQLQAVQQGDFSDEELQAARRTVISRLHNGENTQNGITGFYVGQSLNPVMLTPDQTIWETQRVTRAEIMALAKTVNLQSVYTIIPQEEVAE